MRYFTHQGKPVIIVQTADIPADLRPSGKRAHFTQEALNAIRGMRITDGLYIKTIYVEEDMPATIVDNRRERPFWAIHAHHKARHPQPSPFRRMDRWPVTDQVTVEMVVKNQVAMLVRAYAGDRMPPLPWQVSVTEYPGGRDGSIHHWRSRSFLYRPGLTLKGKSRMSPPSWYLH